LCTIVFSALRPRRRKYAYGKLSKNLSLQDALSARDRSSILERSIVPKFSLAHTLSLRVIAAAIRKKASESSVKTRPGHNALRTCAPTRSVPSRAQVTGSAAYTRTRVHVAAVRCASAATSPLSAVSRGATCARPCVIRRPQTMQNNVKRKPNKRRRVILR